MEANNIVTICYGNMRSWDSRSAAIRFFRAAMAGSDPDSSEYNHYEKIVSQLRLGCDVCTD